MLFWPCFVLMTNAVILSPEGAKDLDFRFFSLAYARLQNDKT
jgi:hypothetical protein